MVSSRTSCMVCVAHLGVFLSCFFGPIFPCPVAAKEESDSEDAVWGAWGQQSWSAKVAIQNAWFVGWPGFASFGFFSFWPY